MIVFPISKFVQRGGFGTDTERHASVTTMKKPEIHEPSQTMSAENQCKHGEMRLSP